MKKSGISSIRPLILALLMFVSFFCGCISEPADQSHGTDTEQLAFESNLFALDMYRELASGDDNLFFSPWSLNSALFMTYEGARGETAEEMRKVLHHSANESMRRRSFSQLDQRINAIDSGYVLSTANALWVDEGFTLEDSYQDLVEETYNSRAMNLNFKGESEESRAVINAWVREKTKGNIVDLIPAGHITPLTRLVLTNAIYFKGTWRNEFNPEVTEEEAFFMEDGRTVTVPMMRKVDEESQFGYLERGDLQILQMPYQGENISLLILLPKKNELESLERSLSIERLAGWREGLKEQRVDIYIPRFKFSAKYLLSENLERMGMPTAFVETADFSAMSPNRKIFISEVIHQAYVDVNEEGTVAAAATAVAVAEGIGAVEEEIPIFRADHPFLFVITEDETGLILFMGRFSDPGRV